MESLKCYLAKPTLEDKVNFSKTLSRFGNSEANVKEVQNKKSKLSLKRQPSYIKSKAPETPPPHSKCVQITIFGNDNTYSPSSQDSNKTIIYTPPNTQLVKRNLNMEISMPEMQDKMSTNPVSNMLQNVMYKQAGSMFMGAHFSGCTFNINLPKPN